MAPYNLPTVHATDTVALCDPLRVVFQRAEWLALAQTLQVRLYQMTMPQIRHIPSLPICSMSRILGATVSGLELGGQSALVFLPAAS